MTKDGTAQAGKDGKHKNMNNSDRKSGHIYALVLFESLELAVLLVSLISLVSLLSLVP